MAGGTGVIDWQHDGYMMLLDAPVTVPSVCVWPRPMACPTSCSVTRARNSDCPSEGMSALVVKITKPYVILENVVPLTITVTPLEHAPPMAITPLVVMSSSGSSYVMRPPPGTGGAPQLRIDVGRHEPCAAIRERERRTRRVRPRTQGLRDLRLAVAGVERRRRQRVAVPQHGLASVGLVPAHVAEQLVGLDGGRRPGEVGGRRQVTALAPTAASALAPARLARPRRSPRASDAQGARRRSAGSPVSCRTSSAPASVSRTP